MFGMLSSAYITIARKGNQPQSPVDIIQCRHPNLLIGCHSSNCLLFKAVIFSYIVSALLMNINQEIQYFYLGARNFLVSHFLTGSSYSFRHRQAKMTLKTKNTHSYIPSFSQCIKFILNQPCVEQIHQRIMYYINRIGYISQELAYLCRLLIRSSTRRPQPHKKRKNHNYTKSFINTIMQIGSNPSR